MNKLSVTIAIALAVLCVATIYYNWHPTSTNIDELELVEETIEITKPKLPPPADLNSPAVKTLGTHTSDNSNPKVNYSCFICEFFYHITFTGMQFLQGALHCYCTVTKLVLCFMFSCF